MPIETIDIEKCDGCGICERSCSQDVIRMDEESKKAVIKYKIDCMACFNCQLFCPKEAVYVTPDKGMIGILMWD